MESSPLLDAKLLSEKLSTINRDTFLGDDDARARLLHEAYQLVYRLEDPFETIRRITFVQPTLLLALLLASRMNLFAALRRPSESALSSSSDLKAIPTLATSLNADPDLIQRLLRHLAAHHIVTEHRYPHPHLPPPSPSSQRSNGGKSESSDRSSSAGSEFFAYGPTPLSEVLSNSDNCVGFREVVNRYVPIFAAAPAWFEEHGWCCPSDARNTVFQRAFSSNVSENGSGNGNVDRGGDCVETRETKLTFFEWLQLPQNRRASDEFGKLMEMGVRGERASWLDVRDVADLVVAVRRGSRIDREDGDDGDGKKTEEEETLLVDIGGSFGQDAREFRRRYPDARGRVVVQDLPATIAAALAKEQKEKKVPPLQLHEEELENKTETSTTASTSRIGGVGDDLKNIIFQAHDFFSEQPVKGARMYLMASVLHDWPEGDARRILRRVASAMKKDYSRLFLSEMVLPDATSSAKDSNYLPYTPSSRPILSAIDLCMMVELGARERSEDDWRRLLATEGLDVVKVHTSLAATRSIIEAKLV